MNPASPASAYYNVKWRLLKGKQNFGPTTPTEITFFFSLEQTFRVPKTFYGASRTDVLLQKPCTVQDFFSNFPSQFRSKNHSISPRKECNFLERYPRFSTGKIWLSFDQTPSNSKFEHQNRPK